MKSLDKPLIIWKIEENSRSQKLPWITRQWWKNEVTNGHDWKKISMKEKLLYIFSLYLYLIYIFLVEWQKLKIMKYILLVRSLLFYLGLLLFYHFRPFHWSVDHWTSKDEDFRSFDNFAWICKFILPFCSFWLLV